MFPMGNDPSETGHYVALQSWSYPSYVPLQQAVCMVDLETDYGVTIRILDLSLSPFDWTSLPAPRKVYPEWCECVCTSSLVPYSRLTGLTFLKFPGKQRAVEFLCRDKPVPHSRISMEEWERESAKTWGIYGTLRMSKHIQPFLFFLDESLGNLFALTARVF